jgi:hypothetical protein
MGGGPKLTEMPMDCAFAGFGIEIAVKSIATARNATKNFVRVVDRRTIVSSLDNGKMMFTAAAAA